MRAALAVMLVALAGCGDGATEAVDGALDAMIAADAGPDAMPARPDAAPEAADAGPPEGPPQPASDFALGLGLGIDRFVEVEHGATAALQRGCQGAQHVWLSLRSPALEPGAYVMTLSAARAGDGVEAVPAHDLEFPWTAAGEGAELLGVQLVIFDALLVVDAEVDVRVEVQAGDGRVGRAVHRLRIEWGPDDC